jgi:hypothetical protein
MPAVVDICNVALAHIGDSANIQSIDPPDSSVQAKYCAIFYPIALKALLEMNSWGFATRRAPLASVANPSSTWLFAYAQPANMINAIAVLSPDALDDYSQNFGVQQSDSIQAVWPVYPDFAWFDPAANCYTPQPYVLEIDAEGNSILLTNQQNAVLRFTIEVNDPTNFTPLFVLSLSYLLASMVAGPILKGEPGAQMAAAMLKMFSAIDLQAEASDASQRRVVVRQSVPWMAGR